MIAARIDAGAAEARRPGDHQPVGQLFHRDAEVAQHLDHDRDAIALLHAQLGGVANLGRALRARGGDAEDRELVDAATSSSPAMRASRGAPGGGRRATRPAPRRAARARPRCRRPSRRARRAARYASGSSRRPVSSSSEPGTSAAATIRNAAEEKSPGSATVVPCNACGPSSSTQSSAPRSAHAEVAQHALGVIARAHRLLDPGRPAGLQAGEEDRRLHLRARDRERVRDADERTALDAERCPAVARLARDRRAHATERLDHPPHRPAQERSVTGETARERTPREHARDEPDGRAGVLAVERGGGCAEAGEAGARDAELLARVARS